MTIRSWTLIILLAGCVTAAQAQDDTRDWKRWTVRYFSVLDIGNDFNAGSLASYLEDNNFDGSEQGFFGTTLDYPLTRVEGGTGWSLLAAYAYRPWLKVGGSFHRAVHPVARGLRLRPNESGRVKLKHAMWAVAPVAVWTPASNVAVGAGPAVIRGTVGFSDGRFTLGPSAPPREESYLRLGVVAFASLGFTLFRRTLYFGVQGQYLYGGEADVGPYELEAYSAGVGRVRVDQFMFGPVVALNL